MHFRCLLIVKGLRSCNNLCRRTESRDESRSLTQSRRQGNPKYLELKKNFKHKAKLSISESKASRIAFISQRFTHTANTPVRSEVATRLLIYSRDDVICQQRGDIFVDNKYVTAIRRMTIHKNFQGLLFEISGQKRENNSI